MFRQRKLLKQNFIPPTVVSVQKSLSVCLSVFHCLCLFFVSLFVCLCLCLCLDNGRKRFVLCLNDRSFGSEPSLPIFFDWFLCRSLHFLPLDSIVGNLHSPQSFLPLCFVVSLSVRFVLSCLSLVRLLLLSRPEKNVGNNKSHCFFYWQRNQFGSSKDQQLNFVTFKVVFH